MTVIRCLYVNKIALIFVISCIPLIATDMKLNPISVSRVVFSITADKIRGQSKKFTGINLENLCFSHTSEWVDPNV